jgi:NAD(P)H-quinone oxidoreductase subunit 5
MATACLALRQPGKRPGQLPRRAELAALAALALTASALGVHVAQGGGTGPLRLRVDAISLTLALLVSVIGWVVMRYSRSYLDGEENEGPFHGLMLATLAAVPVFVQAGNLVLLTAAAIAIRLGLRRLLLLYPDRPEARRAAAKFTLVWHGGDVALALAAILMPAIHGTADIAAITATLSDAGAGIAGHAAAALLILAAILKTAAFPLHGWLTEVMEAPISAA